MIEKKEKPKPHIDSLKQRIKYLEDNDPYNETLQVLKRHVTEHEKPKSLIDALKQRIKYLEDNDPHNETLEVLKRHVEEQEWRVLPN